MGDNNTPGPTGISPPPAAAPDPTAASKPANSATWSFSPLRMRPPIVGLNPIDNLTGFNAQKFLLESDAKKLLDALPHFHFAFAASAPDNSIAIDKPEIVQVLRDVVADDGSTVPTAAPATAFFSFSAQSNVQATRHFRLFKLPPGQPRVSSEVDVTLQGQLTHKWHKDDERGWEFNIAVTGQQNVANDPANIATQIQVSPSFTYIIPLKFGFAISFQAQLTGQAVWAPDTPVDPQVAVQGTPALQWTAGPVTFSLQGNAGFTNQRDPANPSGRMNTFDTGAFFGISVTLP